ncbi:MAG: Sporulation-specific N-acetylmuramoyl-L-alanine amidase [Pelotomaculum sp. PtaB.Bin104]|nr:MAG: Sporulation-specific N-acetylmuramoyl-L-alanine amidase [Pelotomaculum sp. PtaB.Bin104]
MKLMLDPGHGGKDAGAVGNGLQEKDLNLDIAKRVAGKLAAYDVDIALTRNTDLELSLTKRCEIANKLQSDYFCSIHTNSGGGTGYESYVFTGAQEGTEKLRAVIHNVVAGYYKNAGFVDRGKKRANFAVLRDTDMPAILLENLFIDHKQDAGRLKDAAFRDALAGAISKGLVQALNLSLKRQPEKTPVKAAAAAQPFQASSFLSAKNPQAPDYVDIYVQMGKKYGIRWDAVFAQSCKETAFWRYGGDVKPEQNNFAGLSTFDGKPGATFATPAEGVEAQFQHWHVYYYGGNLPAGVKNLDPRRDAVLKTGWAGTLQYVEDLGGRWAPSKEYGASIVDNYLKPMLKISIDRWDPSGEIAKLKKDGLINGDHQPGDPVTWGELATVINRLRGK